MDHYAVFGNPISHSKSPQIHTLFAQQTGQILIYTAELAEVDNFEEAVNAFVANNGKGINITVPFKQQAWQLAAQRSSRAERAGAVNTIIVKQGGSYFGENTDGVGLARDLSNNHQIELKQKKILILGAGGAVRGVIEPIMEKNPAELVIANRTVEKAIQLAEDFSDLGDIIGCGFDALEDQSFDIVINGTSASLQGDLPPLPDALFNDNACAYDMMYSEKPTVFMEWASQHGAENVFDGLGMLVEQAAESFNLWRGVQPETQPVIDAIRNSLK
ncbi:MAG: shikimate dehydrogenase [Gammaproteobacteria bacterium]|nr:shikimate dehydrogenase [Gammaproteobacteria bacterium]MCK5262270.1 shikimate dehydrogenase [Gammaproteobacteria bacterium]